MDGTRVVLVVEENDQTRDLMASWLNQAGFMPLPCAGPVAPDYTCPGGRSEACPLAEFADLVVLSLWLESDTAMQGIPGWQLLPYYVSMGKPVVALATEGSMLDPGPGTGVKVLRRVPSRDELISTVRELLAESRARRATISLPDVEGRPEHAR